MNTKQLIRARHPRNLASITSLLSRRRMSHSPVPILLIGATKAVGRPVVEGLRPDYEGMQRVAHFYPSSPQLLSEQAPRPCPVIHFIQTADHAKKVIPQILSGNQQPETGDGTLGSLNFDKKPMAIIVGGRFDTQTVQDLKRHVTETLNQNQRGAGKASKKGVAWLTRGPNAEVRLGKNLSAYSLNAVEAVRRVLNRLRDRDELEKDELHFW